MQDRTLSKLLIGSLAIVGFACSQGDSDFQRAVSSARQQGLANNPGVGLGLPFFQENTLTPVWGDDAKEGAAKFPSLNFVDHRGESFSLAKVQGRRSLVAFLFTSCAGFCPTLVKKLKKIDHSWGRSKDLQFILITVDPDVDSVSALSEFANDHEVGSDPRWFFLTGKKQVIHSMIRDVFASEVKELTNANLRKFAHTEHFYLLDDEAYIRAIENGTRLDAGKKLEARFNELLKPDKLVHANK